MTWIIFIFFTLVIRIESSTIQGTKIHIQPKPSEILNIIDATSKTNDLKELEGTTDGVCIRTQQVKEFFLHYPKNVKQLEEVFDRFVFDYIVKNLWDYCKKVRNLVSQIKEFTSTDVESIKFGKTFDYCVVTYLFNSDKTNRIVDDILNPIYYLQTLPYIQFSDTNDMKINIDQTMNSIINTIKLYSRDHPGDINNSMVNKYSTTELTDQLRNIRSKITNMSKSFCSITAPPIMNINLILEPKILDPSSKFIRSILYNEIISLTYDVFYENNKTQYIILKWIVDENKGSTEVQIRYYIKLVTTNYMDHLHTEIKYAKGRTASEIFPVDKTSRIMKTNESLNTLLQSLKTNIMYDRRHYSNAVQYHTIMVDVLMILATKLGGRILRGMKSIIGEKCLFINQNKMLGIEFTQDIVNIVRSQLLQFRFYYSKMIDMIKLRLNVILHLAYNATQYYTLLEVTQQILRLIDIPSPVDKRVQNICGDLELALYIIGVSDVNGFYFDQVKFKRFYLIDTTLNMYEIYDYFSSFINYHLTLTGND